MDLAEDLFGHAPFAEQLAKSVLRNATEDGLVLALHGPWGSGKTTALGYVRHFLEQSTGSSEEKPIVVQFNPWWFSGREELARAYLHQLQAVLPGKSKKLEKLGKVLGEYAEAVGGLIDLTGVTGGLGAKLGRVLGSLLENKPKDVPALKAKIGKVLREARIRILVIVDDIDRLDLHEVRQVFTVIKALGDFPYVTYLLAFDREVASQAIERDSGLPGDRYLEKIVQVPFELPPVDKVALRAALSKRLDQVMVGTPDGLFDSSYWANVYMEGIDPLIRVPRDIVRVVNTLSVTYSAVVGEVNAVDFIAIEAIRVFLPRLYDTIRANPDRFAGHSRDDRYEGDRRAAEAFQEAWVSELPEACRASTRALVHRLFPKTDNTIYGPDWLAEWRRKARVCHPDLFPIYFRLSMPSGAISRREMLEFVGSIARPDAFKERLRTAKNQRRPDGVSKARALLERLMDHVEKDVPNDLVPTAIEALLDVGDELIDPADERGMFDFGNVSRVSRPVYHLLKRLPAAQRAGAMEAAVRNGAAIAAQLRLIRAFDEEIEKAEASPEAVLLQKDEVTQLKAAWVARIRAMSTGPGFLAHPELPRLLAAWRVWGSDDEVRVWCAAAVRTDDGLLRFLTGCLQHTKSQGFGEWAVRLRPRLNPKWLEPYLDIEDCAARLQRLQQAGAVPDWASEAVTQFLRERAMLAAGKDPDGLLAFDDEDRV